MTISTYGDRIIASELSKTPGILYFNYDDIPPCKPMKDENNQYILNDRRVFIGHIPISMLNQINKIQDIFEGRINNIFIPPRQKNVGCITAYTNRRGFAELFDIFNNRLFFGKTGLWYDGTPEGTSCAERLHYLSKNKIEASPGFPIYPINIEHAYRENRSISSSLNPANLEMPRAPICTYIFYTCIYPFERNPQSTSWSIESCELEDEATVLHCYRHNPYSLTGPHETVKYKRPPN